MSEENWQVIEEVGGDLQAEILRGLLEAQGIQVLLSQEGIAHFAYSLTVGPLSTVQILVPTSQLEAAAKTMARDAVEDATPLLFEWVIA